MSAEDWTALATVVIAAFTIILAVGGGFQVWLTRRAIMETNRQHTVSNRAFVFIRQFLSVSTSASGDCVEFWRITPVFENSGNTATKRMMSGHSAELRTTKLPKDFDYRDSAFPDPTKPIFISRDIIGPRAQLNGAPYILSLADVQAIGRGEKFFVIWGWVDYDDVFTGTKRHRIEYCYQLTVLFDPSNPKYTNAVAMGLYGPYNNVDEQCRYDPGPFIPA
jgi:hypothetical protein